MKINLYKRNFCEVTTPNEMMLHLDKLIPVYNPFLRSLAQRIPNFLLEKKKGHQQQVQNQSKEEKYIA